MATSPHVWLCQQIVDNTQDAVIFADREGIIRLWNTGAETMGQSLDLLIPEHLRARHWEGYRRVMATGRIPYARQLLAGHRGCGKTAHGFPWNLRWCSSRRPPGRCSVLQPYSVM